MAYYKKTASTPGGERKIRKPKSAKTYLVWLLARRDYSESALREKLRLKEFSEEESNEAISFVQKHGFQSDERYAHQRAASRSRQRGNWRVKQELLGKGISEEIANAEVQELEPEDDRALDAARRFLGKEITPELNQKIYRFLAQRGFGSKSIKFVLGRLKEEAKNSSD